MSEKGLIIITAIVWAAIAISSAFIVVYTGTTGVVFAFTILAAAILAWARVLREGEGHEQYRAREEPCRVKQ
mgnify:CR=1 FL=1